MRHQDRKKISDILVSSGWVRSGRGRSNFERRNRWRRNGYTVYISDLRQVKIETDGKTYERQTVAFVGPYSGIGWTQKTADEINCVVDSLPNFKN